MGIAEAIAVILAQVGLEGFPHALLDLLNFEVRVDAASALLYGRTRPPRVLAEQAEGSRLPPRPSRYVMGAYLLDPFYLASREIAEPVFLRLADVAGEDFERSDYYTTYYKSIRVVDEVNYLVPLEPGRVFTIGLERTKRTGAFNKTELAKLAQWLPALAEFVGRHATACGGLFPSEITKEMQENGRIEGILHRFGTSVLTSREANVVRFMLAGMSAGAIARALSISLGTVRVHRRNAYHKLAISSQGQLFALALKAISSASGEDRDPLLDVGHWANKARADAPVATPPALPARERGEAGQAEP
ncbi:MAG TPA: helix-turn-helix transcriptional regulator [Hyphomicrobiaceae bacterium]|jgi:DNA-binding CsgD family transcriptional regulator|nr:helix-turn-helix transcriptional regulator [Hyphomicrobiaceae bacterium]